jgi:hypothetical protein
MKKTALRIFLIAISSICLAEPSLAQARANFTYDALINCTKPKVSNFPVHIEGTGSLSTDRRASLGVQSNLNGAENYNVKLGGPASRARDGSASLRVTGRRSLRAVRDYPNNVAVVDLRVVGSSCTIKVEHRLKPGRSQYTFNTSLGLAYCDRPRLVKASCVGS